MVSKLKIRKLLKNFDSGKNLEGSAIINREGLVLFSDLPKIIDPEIFSVANCMIFGTADKALTGLGKGNIEKLIIISQKSKFVLKLINKDNFLVLLMDKKINLDLFSDKIDKLMRKLEKLI